MSLLSFEISSYCTGPPAVTLLHLPIALVSLPLQLQTPFQIVPGHQSKKIARALGEEG